MQGEFAHIWNDPAGNGLSEEPIEIKDITEAHDGKYIFFGKLVTKNLRDLNEAIFIQKRGGRRIERNTEMLNLVLADDTANIRAAIEPRLYEKLGKPIVENGKLGDWYLWRGTVRKGFLQVKIEKWRKL